MNTSIHRPSRLTWFLLGGLLLLGSIGLFAQQKSSPTSPSSPCLTPLVAADSSSSAAEAQALLPVIPQAPIPSLPSSSLQLGESPGSQTPLLPSSPASPDPDDFKILYGYSGPYYNTDSLDGRVVVLNQSVYSWSTANWKVTGMLRNQTRCSIRITGVIARLKGPGGELLAIATATIPVAQLRPGEPAPFIIEALLPTTEVRSIDWQVNYAPAESQVRLFHTEVDSESIDETGYHLVGVLFNDAQAPVQVQMVGAWLDAGGRVVFVDYLPLIVGASPPKYQDTVPLGVGQLVNFAYATTDAAVAPLLGTSQDVFWEVSK